MSVLKSTSPPSQTGTSMFAAGGVGGSVQCVSAFDNYSLIYMDLNMIIIVSYTRKEEAARY